MYFCPFLLCVFLNLTPSLQLPLQFWRQHVPPHCWFIFYQTTQHHIPEDCDLHSYYCKELKSSTECAYLLILIFFLFLLPPEGTPKCSLACLRTSSLSLQRNLDLTTTLVGKVTGLEWEYVMVLTEKYFLNRILCVKWVHHYAMASSDAAEIASARYGEQLKIQWIGSHIQPLTGGSSTSGVG